MSRTSNTSSKKKTNSQNANEQMKYEVASELGVNLGADASSRQNGKVGGEMTRRLVTMAKSNLKSNSSSK